MYSQLASYGSGGATSLPSNAIAIANAGASHLSSRGPTPPPGTSGAVNTTATGTGTARITNTNTSGSGGGAAAGGGGKQARLSKGTELATIDTIRALNPNLSPFTSMYDACDRLFPYHVSSTLTLAMPSKARHTQALTSFFFFFFFFLFDLIWFLFCMIRRCTRRIFSSSISSCRCRMG